MPKRTPVQRAPSNRRRQYRRRKLKPVEPKIERALRALFREHADTVSHLPEMDAALWQHVNRQYDQDSVRTVMLQYILDEKPAFPYFRVPRDDMINCFQRLRELYYKSADRITWHGIDGHMRVVEQHHDYKFGFHQVHRTSPSWAPVLDTLASKNTREKLIKSNAIAPFLDAPRINGLVTISAGHHFNAASNYFHLLERVKCSDHRPSVYEQWHTGDYLRGTLGTLWRLQSKRRPPHLSIQEYQKALRCGAYIASQFKPQNALTLHWLVQGKRVLDTSAGWGDRLCAFYATPHTKLYVACDPNDRVFRAYRLQCIAYERLLGCYEPKVTHDRVKGVFECVGVKHVVLYCAAAEDVPWVSRFLHTFDMFFTSPPYFNTERYAQCSECESSQSWSRYPTFESWKHTFMMPLMKKTASLMAPGGYMCLNMHDPRITNKKIRCPIVDDLLTMLTTSTCDGGAGLVYVGEVGMRLTQRVRALPREQLERYMKQCLVEPIWILQAPCKKNQNNNGCCPPPPRLCPWSRCLSS